MTSRPGLQDLAQATVEHDEQVKHKTAMTFRVLCRIHHCLGDGTSLMSMLLASTRQIAHPDQLPNLPGSSKPSAPANATQPGKAAPDAKAPPSLHTEASTETLDALATKAAEGNSTTPSGLVDAPTETGSAKEWGAMPKKKPILSMVKNSLFHVSQFSAVFLAVGDTSTAVKRPPQASNQRQMIMAFSDTIPLAEMSAVRKACGTVSASTAKSPAQAMSLPRVRAS